MSPVLNVSKISYYSSNLMTGVHTHTISDALKAFSLKGFAIDKSLYKDDALTSRADLEMLFNLLLIFKNASVQHPVITANAIMANLVLKKLRNLILMSIILSLLQKI